MFISDTQLAERFAVSRATIWRWERVDPTFPCPVKLSRGCTRWRLSDIENWEQHRAQTAA
ncbi:MAG: AlpA family phage regulatory protein [Sphingobium sp.]|nr:AlpA family phage regulatory protein [Sphingobium sp.]MCI1270401.1 AlpA family phage regulatory protein [Sphingobium sp.]MCI1755569.1 AlpA family phage regulatory protein [Sphingobium sp.]MCI2052944.1 AlpA family phage regulatory protein [Sphingobium sp.]